MAINTNKQVPALFYNGTPLVLNSNANPTNTYAQIAGKTVIHLKAEDLVGLTSIPANFQMSNSNLKTVIIPNTVTTIGDRAFSMTRNLDYFDFAPNSVFEGVYGPQEVWGESGIKELILPPSFKSFVSRNLFYACYNLTKLVFGTGTVNLSDTLNMINLQAIIILKDCSTTSDVPTITSSTIRPSDAKIYLINNETRISFSSATNWGANASRMFILNKIVIDGVEHYIALPNSDTMTQALTKGYLADMHNTDLTALYDFYTDSELTTPFTMSSLVSDYVTSLGTGFTVYTKPKEN